MNTQFIVALVLCLATALVSAQAQEQLSDTGFESGTITVYGSAPLPVCTGGWCTNTAGAGTVSHVTSPVHEGTLAVRIDTSSASAGRIIYQDFTVPGACFAFHVWVYRESGINDIEIVTDWDRGVVGAGNAVSSVEFHDDGLVFIAWNTHVEFGFLVTPDAWHDVAINADTGQGIQELFIDGAFVGQVTAGSVPPGGTAGTVIIGDTAGFAHQGAYVYDDASVQIGPCALCELRSDCRTAEKSVLVFKDDPAENAKDKLIWKWIKGPPTSQSEFGDPINSADYTLCLYVGPAADVFTELTVAADTAKWHEIDGKGYKYKDQSGVASGVQKIVLKGSTENRSNAIVKGKGAGLPDPGLGSLSLPVTAQLVNDTNSTCFEAVYDSGNVIKNDAKQFKAKTP